MALFFLCGTCMADSFVSVRHFLADCRTKCQTRFLSLQKHWSAQYKNHIDMAIRERESTNSNLFNYYFPQAESMKEFTSPEEGWDVDPNFDSTLSHGEVHIREYTAAVLK